jgi:hypothetical protein
MSSIYNRLNIPGKVKNYTFSSYLFALFSLLFVNNFVAAQTFNTSGTYTVPAGVYSVKVEAWGGGGGGGSIASGNDRRGGGGGGAYASSILEVSPGDIIPVTVGNSGGVGVAGGQSSFSTYVIALGGSSTASETGGTGGLASGSTGTIKWSGGNGGNGTNNGGGGGGGGSASTTANGSNGSDGGSNSGGNGGSGTGAGGRGGDQDGSPAAVAGTAPGGGGGGRGDDAGSSAAGAAGRVIVTPIAYHAKFISMNTGSADWCAGETRTVTVTVKNIGTTTWTNSGSDVNIGVKWNEWLDYDVRTDANDLAPGATQTYSLTVTATSASGTNNLTFDIVKEGDCWFGNNNGSCGPGNSIFISPTMNILLPPVAITETDLSQNGFTAKWNSVSGATGYRLDVSSVSNFASFLTGYENLDVSNVTSFPVTGITYGTNYYYRVRAYNANCTSSNSNTITVTTRKTGDYRSAATGNWNTRSTWQRWNGTSWVQPSSGEGTPTSSSGLVTILSPHNVTVTVNVSVDQVTITSGGKVTVNSGITLTIANGADTYDMFVAGILLNNSGTVTTTGTLEILDGGKYQHGNTTTQGTIPTATWNSGSICEIIGYTTNTNAPGGLGQSFHHFIWNCTGQTANLNLAGGLTTVNGDFNVLSTNSGQLRLTATTGLTLTVGGNLKINAGILDFASGAASTKILNLGGNYTQTGGTFTNSNSNVLTFNFTGSGKTFTQSSGTLTNTNINWDIKTGAILALSNNLPVASSRSCIVNGILDCGITTAVTGSGSFTLSNGGTLIIGSPSGITSSGASGNIQVTGSRTFNTGGKYTYSNTNSQVTGNGLPATINTLTVAGSNPLTLTNSTSTSSPFTVTNLSINSGKFELGSTQHMTITGNTTLIGTTCLILKSSSGSTASFFDNGISGSGTVLAERFIPNDWKWHFLSSPVASQSIWPSFAPDPGAGLNFGTTWNWDFYYWNPNANTSNSLYWVNLRKDNGDYNDNAVDITGSLAGFGSATPEMVTGRGYLAAYNTGWNPATGSPTTHAFTGNLNTGNITKAILIGENSFNLVGNPYASSIDWKSSNWGTGRNALVNNAGGFDYWIWNDTDGNYGVFNSAGADNSGTLGVSRNIAPQQAFFVQASADGNLAMNNTVRTHSTQSWLKGEEAENSALRLELSTPNNSYHDEMIVEFNPAFNGGGSSKFWSFYTEAPEIYTVKDGAYYSIDRYTDLSRNTKVQLGTKTESGVDYVINASNISDFDLTNKVYLEDLATGSLTDLRMNPSYSFKGGAGQNTERFRLIFEASTGINPLDASNFNVYSSGKTVYILNNGVKNEFKTEIINISGQVVSFNENTRDEITKIELNAAPGVYIVRIISSGKVTSVKVVLQ